MKYLFALVILMSCINCKPKPDTEIQNDSVLAETPVDLKGFYKAAANSVLIYDKLNFGNGYNSVTGKELFGVLNYENAEASTEVVANALGNSGFVSMDIVSTKAELKEALDINVKVELDIIVGGFTSDNSAKVDIYRETQFSDFNQNAVLKAQYTNEPIVMLNPEVKDKWIALAKRDPDEFMRSCGDMFVSRIYTGGNMYALFSLHSRDTYEKEKNETFFKSVNGYLGNKMGVEVSTSALNETMNSVSNIKTEVFSEGGGDTPATTDIESFVAYANAFKTQVAVDNRPIILYVQLSPYESIAGFPKDVNFDKIRVVQQEFLESCAEYFDALEISKANAAFVVKNTMFFEDSDVELAKALDDTLEDKTSVLRALMGRCESDFNDCDFEMLSFIFETFMLFNPKMDFPEFVGLDVELPLDPATGYVDVFPDTESGMKLAITGKLESRFRDYAANVTCKDISFHSGRVSRSSFLVKRGFLKRNHNVDIYEYWERPYYMIKYTSVETNKVLREFRWNGAPFITEKKVKLSIKLVNRPSEYQWKYDISDEIYTNKWVDIGKKLKKQYGFDATSRFVGVRSCNSQTPFVTISAPKAKPEDVATATKSKVYPKTILKEGYITYEYNE